MRCFLDGVPSLLPALLLVANWIAPAGSALGAPRVESQSGTVVVVADGYRARFVPESAGFELDLQDAGGRWLPVAINASGTVFGFFDGREFPSGGRRATWALRHSDDGVIVGQQLVVDARRGQVLEVHFGCTDRGVLVGMRLVGPASGDVSGWLWSPPRFRLDPQRWAGYRFWDAAGRCRTGLIAALDPCPAYAGVSPWEQQGDTVAALDAQRPALLIEPANGGTSLAVVYVDYAARWRAAKMFVQRHQPDAVFLYSGYAPAAAAKEPLWAYLAPLSSSEANVSDRVAALAREGQECIAVFPRVAPPVPDSWLTELADFPEALCRAKPVEDIREAVVFTINETTATEDALRLAREVGSDVLIRGWFKWREAPPVSRWTGIPPQVRQRGALFGGGITCSALYDDENGITHAQLLDMATRGPAGQLLDAWETPGIRHGSLSNPAYRDYLFGWCRQQIDAGVDYLFLDEHTAVLSGLEGFDDHSLADFRRYLLAACPQTQGWAAGDLRWSSRWSVKLTDREVCPDATMRSFNYRAYLQRNSWTQAPDAAPNPLAPLWLAFRQWRDDAAWKELTDRIREYGRGQGRQILISANGNAPYVDLQVLGVWGHWRTRDGRIDLADSQLPVWRSIVRRGQQVAGKPVPVVLFHDWGFGDPPFPWLAVRPSERELWMRTRGAEIYAAGGFFAFPVLGPFGCHAEHDGTLAVIQRLTAFYQRQRDLFSGCRYVGAERLETDTAEVSLAAWSSQRSPVLLVHAVNRRVAAAADYDSRQLELRRNVTITIPAVAELPRSAGAVSPDWDGELAVEGQLVSGALKITVPRLDASAIVVLRWDANERMPVDLERLQDPVRIVPVPLWARPAHNEFPVRADGTVDGEEQLNGFLQGRLHEHLRNPPAFLVHAVQPVRLLVKIRAVATGGAQLVASVGGQMLKTIELPDRDGQNDGSAPEYDQVVEIEIPAGRHRVTVDNLGADWVTIAWYQFDGRLADW